MTSYNTFSSETTKTEHTHSQTPNRHTLYSLIDFRNSDFVFFFLFFQCLLSLETRDRFAFIVSFNNGLFVLIKPKFIITYCAKCFRKFAPNPLNRLLPIFFFFFFLVIFSWFLYLNRTKHGRFSVETMKTTARIIIIDE